MVPRAMDATTASAFHRVFTGVSGSINFAYLLYVLRVLFAMLFLYHMSLIQPVRDIIYLNESRRAMGH